MARVVAAAVGPMGTQRANGGEPLRNQEPSSQEGEAEPRFSSFTVSLLHGGRRGCSPEKCTVDCPDDSPTFGPEDQREGAPGNRKYQQDTERGSGV